MVWLKYAFFVWLLWVGFNLLLGFFSIMWR